MSQNENLNQITSLQLILASCPLEMPSGIFPSKRLPIGTWTTYGPRASPSEDKANSAGRHRKHPPREICRERGLRFLRRRAHPIRVRHPPVPGRAIPQALGPASPQVPARSPQFPAEPFPPPGSGPAPPPSGPNSAPLSRSKPCAPSSRSQPGHPHPPARHLPPQLLGPVPSSSGPSATPHPRRQLPDSLPSPVAPGPPPGFRDQSTPLGSKPGPLQLPA